MKMLVILPMKISLCYGRSLSGCLRIFLSAYSDASSIARKSKKSTAEFSIIEKPSGQW
jgi:hypothetical protein